MLTKFTVSNYRGFKEPTALDLSHPRDYSFNTEYVTNGVVTNALIIGPNASGKSNLLSALVDIRTNFFAPGNSFGPIDADEGFLNANSMLQEATFEYEFLFDGARVLYRYAKAADRGIKEEVLSLNDKIVFDYSVKDGLRDSNLGLIDAQSLNWTFSDEYSSALAYVSSNAPVQKNGVLDRLRSFTSGITRATHDGWNSPRVLDGYVREIIKKDKVLELEEFLNGFGINEKLMVREGADGSRSIYCKHTRPIPLALCISSGTRTLLSLFVFYRLRSRAMYLLDEFDAYCHFELAENLLRFFGSTPECQTICTTHNTSLTRNGVMRPDCIFKFGDDGSLRALSDRTDRELGFGSNVERLLRNGEFD